MNRLFLTLALFAIVICAAFSFGNVAHAQTPVGTAFTYQGQLAFDGQLVEDALCDFDFTLYDVESGGDPVGETLSYTGVPVTRGFFSVSLDFGAAPFDGSARWLEIEVGCGVTGSATLSPRMRLAPVPYAIHAASVPWSGVSGAPTFVETESDPTAWRLNGNAATAGAFVGTTNDVALELRVDETTALRLIPGDDTEEDEVATPSVVGGDASNSASEPIEGAFIGGGEGNSVVGDFASISGGRDNTINSDYGVIAGGQGNTTDHSFAAIGGGKDNSASGMYSVVNGGQGNIASATYSVVGGGGGFLAGQGNEVRREYSTIAGGESNTIDHATGSWGATIGGGSSNEILGSSPGGAETISGGANNVIPADADGYGQTIGGGTANSAGGDNATVAGGSGNVASGQISVVGGGSSNEASGDYSTVGGGVLNEAGGAYAVVSGGETNIASAEGSTIGGGQSNTASGPYSTVAGGYGAVAQYYGQRAYANGYFTNPGDAQVSEFVLRGRTVNATPVDLALGDGSHITVPAGRAMQLEFAVAAETESGAYLFGGVTNINAAYNDGTGVQLNFPSVHSLWPSTTWSIQVVVTGPDTFSFRVVGPADQAVRWVAYVRAVEVGRP